MPFNCMPLVVTETNITTAPAARHLATGHQAHPPVRHHQRVLQPARTGQHQGEATRG